MQVREDGTGLNQGGRKWLYSLYSLKVKPEGFTDGFHVSVKEREESEVIPRFLT